MSKHTAANCRINRALHDPKQRAFPPNVIRKAPTRQYRRQRSPLRRRPPSRVAPDRCFRAGSGGARCRDALFLHASGFASSPWPFRGTSIAQQICHGSGQNSVASPIDEMQITQVCERQNYAASVTSNYSRYVSHALKPLRNAIRKVRRCQRVQGLPRPRSTCLLASAFRHQDGSTGARCRNALVANASASASCSWCARGLRSFNGAAPDPAKAAMPLPAAA